MRWSFTWLVAVPGAVAWFYLSYPFARIEWSDRAAEFDVLAFMGPAQCEDWRRAVWLRDEGARCVVWRRYEIWGSQMWQIVEGWGSDRRAADMLRRQELGTSAADGPR